MEALSPLYRLARDHGTFLNLDMEDYKDLDLTIEVFTAILSQPDLADYGAGIVLQAYLPDSPAAMDRLQAWAARRVADGGAPIKVHRARRRTTTGIRTTAAAAIMWARPALWWNCRAAAATVTTLGR